MTPQLATLPSSTGTAAPARRAAALREALALATEIRSSGAALRAHDLDPRN